MKNETEKTATINIKQIRADYEECHDPGPDSRVCFADIGNDALTMCRWIEAAVPKLQILAHMSTNPILKRDIEVLIEQVELDGTMDERPATPAQKKGDEA